MNSFDDQPDDLPEALIAEMRSIYAPEVAVPRSVDAAILTEARAGFARRRRFRLLARSAAAAASVAAAAAVLFVVLRGPHGATPSVPESQSIASAAPAGEDVDHNGKVDILDAFVVAKLIEVRTDIDKTYDVNGDGKVDQSDVDRIATVAVDTSRTEVGRVQ